MNRKQKGMTRAEWLELVEQGRPEDLLPLVNRAIAEILLSGQSYAIEGRKLVRADMPALNALRRSLQAEVSAASGNAVTIAVSKGR